MEGVKYFAYNNNRRGGYNYRSYLIEQKIQQKRSIEVRNGDVMKAIRIFKKKVQEEGILQEYKERQHYEKPSAKRKKAKAAGRKRWLKLQEKQKLERGY